MARRARSARIFDVEKIAPTCTAAAAQCATSGAGARVEGVRGAECGEMFAAEGVSRRRGYSGLSLATLEEAASAGEVATEPRRTSNDVPGEETSARCEAGRQDKGVNIDPERSAGKGMPRGRSGNATGAV